MAILSRRGFIHRTSMLLASALLPLPLLDCQNKPRRLFRMSLNPGAIGVDLNQTALLDMAIRKGFEAIVPLPNDLLKMDVEEKISFIQKKKARKISWDAAGLPLDFRKSGELFRQELKTLPDKCKVMREVEADRMNTWIMPTHKELTYLQNFKQHTKRLKEVARILGDYGIRLGLEYVGPKTLMTSARYPFIHTMKELKELIDNINLPNIGLQLDAFHWFCAEESVEDILNLDQAMIITVDLNDAKSGRTAAEQIDNERELPGDSGVIDLKAFLEALVKIGYDGPVRAEPFNKKLNEKNDHEAIEATYQAMKRSFDLIDR